MKKMTSRILAAFLSLALLTTLTPVGVNTTTKTAQAAVTNGIVYDGEGSVTQTITTGKEVTFSLSDCIPSITVGGEDFNYPYTTTQRHIGTGVISDDDLLHMFWVEGYYVVCDLRTNNQWLYAGATAYDAAAFKATYVKASSTKDSLCVKGLTGKAIHSCIINKSYFYNNSSEMIHLMTRAEFEDLKYDKVAPTAEPTVAPATPVPTVAPVPTVVPTTVVPATQAPAPVPTVAPATQRPVIQEPTMAPLPKYTLTPYTMAPLPTIEPIPVPTVAPRATDGTSTTVTETKFNFELWWQRYLTGEITWEQYIQIMTHAALTAELDTEWWYSKYRQNQITWEQYEAVAFNIKWSSVTVEKYLEKEKYIYDENGRLIYTEKTGEKTSRTDGQLTGDGQKDTKGKETENEKETAKGGETTKVTAEVVIKTEEQNAGKANFQIQETGNLVGSGQAVTVTNSNAEVTDGSKGGSKKSALWHVTRPTKSGYRHGRIKLQKNKGTKCTVIHNSKKRTATFKDITTKKVDRVGYAAGGDHEITYMQRTKKFVKHNGKRYRLYRIIIVPRNKGKAGSKWTYRVLKGLYTHIHTDGECGLDVTAENVKTKHSAGLIKIKAKQLR